MSTFAPPHAVSSLSIFELAARVPRRVALVTPGGELDYAALAGAAARAAARLPDDPDSPVAIVATQTIEFVSLFAAALARGNPVVLVHPRLSDGERTAWLTVASAGRSAPPLLDPAQLDLAALSPRPVADASRTLAPEHVQVVLATSGTTGAPKGVLLSRRALLAAASASARHLGVVADERWLATIPFAHVGGMSILVRMWTVGGAVVLPSPGAFEPSRFVAELEASRATIVSVVPTMLTRIVDARLAAPTRLRAALTGGAPVPRELVLSARALGWPALRTYGMTETCAQIATDPYPPREPLTEGAPLLPGVAARIDEDGIIAIASPTLASRILRAGAEEPVAMSDGFFRTRDRGRIDPGGTLVVHGRADDVIITGGENVDPVEVEQWLERQMGIARACVFGRDDTQWGQRVCAAIVLRSPCSPAQRDALFARLHDAATRDLAAHKRPRAFVILPALAEAASGKLDRRATASRALVHLEPR